VSESPIPSHTFTPVTRLPPPRRLETGRDTAAASAREANGLLPATLLRGCREAVQRISHEGPQSFGVTSALRGEGRSSVAAGLALVEWMDHERRTVLIDLDLASPSLHGRFNLSEGPGIQDLVDGPTNVEDYLQRIVGDVWLLSAGKPRDDVPRAVSRLAGSQILSQLSEWADTIVFDLPPLLGSDAGIAATRLCETPVMVVRAGMTPLPRVKEAVELLATPPPVVLNGVRSALPPWLRRALGDTR
jgi:Mrp family chromosome partitioning ATPase